MRTLVSGPIAATDDSPPLPLLQGMALDEQSNVSDVPDTPVPPNTDRPSVEQRHPATPFPAQANKRTPVGGSRKIRVLLVDDHAVVRQAFAFALRSELDIEVVGEAGSGSAALDMIRRTLPDIVLMDINMPGMNGIDATRLIRAEFPQVEVIGLSMYESEEQSLAMRKAGAKAYVSKSDSYEALLVAIRSPRSQD
jgi:CheY-like chemotaxis protein